ncbi:tetratricopeptide repeat protein [Solimonas terrae]|uniref:tetratricopeptide repeat protein n=1 Tax=Solimonas terrae TaxID=1396819 RepID=UPI001F5092EB|nr:tetratricopeptide repeat protein [Solimonas terrae]
MARQQAVEAQEETQRVRKTKQFFVSIFQNADPMLRKDRAPLTVAGALDDAVNRVDIELDDDPKLQADLLNDLGEIKANSGHLTEAQAMFRRALPLQEKTLAADDPALANTLVNLGVIGRYLSEPVGELQAYMSRAVAILEQHADSEGEALANAREGLAGIYLEQHKDAEAQVLMEQMLAYARQHAGANTRQLGLALGNLGALAYHRHHYDEARRYLTECLGVLESSYGPESAALNDCLATMSELSDALGDLPATVRYAERNELVTRAVEGDHPFRARSLAMLGEARREQGRDAESESLLLQALAMYERLGLAHDLFTTASLARLRDKAHRYADVLRLADGGLTQCAKDSTLTDCRSLTELRARAQAALARKG